MPTYDIRNNIVTNTNVNYNGVISDVKRAGSGWNDILKGIKKASGKKGNTINHD